MSAPAAPNTSQANGHHTVTIDLDSDPTTFKWPLILGEDAQAEAMAPWGLNMERNAAYGTRSHDNSDFVIVSGLVHAAIGRRVVLSQEDAVHVYLLGWAWSRETFGEEPGREKGPLPQGDRLRSLLTSSLNEEERKFLRQMLEDRRSIAWMQGVLRAVAAALEA